MINIEDILEKAPAKIFQYAEEETEAYKREINLHEEYKRLRAKKALEFKARGDVRTAKEIEWLLDTNEELMKIKDEELLAEIEAKGKRNRRDRANDYFESAKAFGWLKRIEWDATNDVIVDKKKREG